jgi:mono/diheme cytochrome c family protein
LLLPITRQGLQEIAQFFLAGVVIFGLLALVTRYRGGSPRRFVQSTALLSALAVVLYGVSFTPLVLNIPTPPVPFTARFASNPVPDTQDNVDSGRRTYQANCAICHGPRGLGDGPQAFVLNPKPFNLQLHVPLHPTGEVFYWISNGVPGTAMPTWGEKLSETERWQVIRYLDALASKRIEQ